MQIPVSQSFIRKQEQFILRITNQKYILEKKVTILIFTKVVYKVISVLTNCKHQDTKTTLRVLLTCICKTQNALQFMTRAVHTLRH
jgi:hypothetical protein